jgi:ABC-2 type transport system permease protein
MRNYSGKLRAAFAVIRTHTKSIAYFKSKLIIDSLATLFRVLVLILVYVNIYKIAPSAGNILPYKSALWSMGGYFFALAFSTRRLFSYLSQLIYTGDIEIYLTRPLNVIVFNAAKIIGENLIQTTITGVTIVAVLLFTVGAPENLSFALILWGIVVLALGLVVDFIIAAIIGLSAFWLENATPIYRIVDKFILILGGSYVPVAFFPEILKNISLYSPFGATRYIAYLFYPDFLDRPFLYVSLQLFWIIVLAVVMVSLYAKGQKHLSVNGS